MKKQLSIKDIAKLSNVSTATVSRVLNNNGRFSEETREKVMSVVKEFGYSTNSVAKTLREQKSHTIGMIVPDISNEFFSSLITKIESYFFDKGISTIICNTNKDAEKEKAYLKSLDSKLVDGLICISGQEEIDETQLSRNIPIVCIDRQPKVSSNISIVGSDHSQGGYKATKLLIDKGCRRILLLTKDNNSTSSNDRIEGYKKALKESDLPVNAELIVRASSEKMSKFETAQKSIEEVLANGLKFDGIFATNDWLAYGAVQILKKNHISVPDEVKVVGFDDDSISKYTSPSITTIHQDVNGIAEEAADILYQLMSKPGKKLNKRYINVPTRLIERETT
ncbi:LacI family DNA-binding transcriptional regulator [Desemzia sp. FAM 23991]|uniref:LacI family DNA-binding transcriptional regulator n=1 Tax=unclassified Desemzia TaxID=2685243 RepID=UPI003886D355